MLLLLADTDTSPKNVMSTITNFGWFSGFTINWSKPAPFPLNQGIHPQLGNYCPVPVVTSFKYLGVVISPQPLDFCHVNILPLLLKFRDKVKIWNKLFLSVAGKAILIKIILLLQLFSHLHNSPVVVPAMEREQCQRQTGTAAKAQG